ncbi:L-lactate permease [Effusibacillus lacus]|uniref:L-lactate permease n=1 Tax=Effusibacillus lacus TaxID=1348429 RepID=A0A292YJW5_9BACL|nr:L-lactate permease [Effusibacillus lacus]TCS69436.1 lactate permease [Effusibacillus lacus]GAX89201.1 hypothetical protein EFBL_0819 [Effusibacillus lacus]
MLLVAAVSPLILVVVLLLLFRRSAVEASFAGLLWAVATGVSMFGLSWSATGESLLDGLDPALRVVYVLSTGLWLYQLLRRTGALERMAGTVERISPDPLRRVLFVVIVIAPFLEAVSGFGAGIVLAGPLIMALGYKGMQAGMLSLLTQNLVPWGAMAVGTTLGAEIAGVHPRQIGILSTLFAVPIFIYWSYAVAVTAAGWRQAVKQSWDVLLAAGLMLAGLSIANRFLTVEAACVFAGLAAAGGLGLIWRKGREKRLQPSFLSGESPVSLMKALVPYLVFLAMIAGTRLLNMIPLIADWFKNHPYLYSPGTAMLVACISVVPLFRMDGQEVRNSLRDTWKQVRPAALSTIGFVLMGMLLKDAGMIEIITGSMSIDGAVYLLAAPLIGGLGGWMTGSNAAANAMWMHFQAGMARSLGMPTDVMASVQNTAAANLTMASPSRVALGAAVAGIIGREGELLQKVLPLSLGVLGLVVVCSILFLAFGELWQNL